MSLDHEGDKELIEMKEKEWSAQDEAMNKLLRDGAQVFLQQIKSLDSAFKKEKECACCIDEGTAHVEMDGKLCMAGSGILYPADSYGGRLERVAKLYLKRGVKKVTSHEGCGAAGIAWKALQAEERENLTEIGIDTPDKYGEKWAKDLQEKMNQTLANQDGEKIKYLHIKADQMERPREFHNARAVWLDGTGRFNPDKLGNFIPKGFVIDTSADARCDDSPAAKNYPLQELQVAINIAFGGRGFSRKFAPESPFAIVIIADNQSDAKQIKERADELLARQEDKIKKSVKVDMFVKG